MGCDIHLVIEYRPVVGHSRPDAEVKALLRAIEADPTSDLAARLRSWEIRSEAWEPALYSVAPIQAAWRLVALGFCDDRNYEAFAVLTGTVRNFDRVPKDQCLSERPRGIPDDASAYSKALAGRWAGDGHSHSWLTVAEILPRVDLLPAGYADMVRWWAKAMPPEHVRLVFFFDN